MTIGEIFDYLYSSQTKNFESLHSNEPRSVTFNLLVFWSLIIVASCLLHCFNWSWSYLIQILEAWPRIFGSLDIDNDVDEEH